MKIATYNINNVNRRLPNLLAWLKRARPDIVCLQELKAADEAFPQAATAQGRLPRAVARPEDLERRRHPEPQSRPILTRNALPGDPGDTQSRYIEAAVDGLLVGCLYLPNGNPQPGPKFKYKLDWFRRLQAHATEAAEERRAGRAGRRLQRRADRLRHLFHELLEGRRAGAARDAARPIARLVAQGWTDSLPSAASPTSRCTPSGTTSGGAGSATPACASTTSCCQPSLSPRLKKRRRRSRGTRPRERQRPRAGLDRAAVVSAIAIQVRSMPRWSGGA